MQFRDIIGQQDVKERLTGSVLRGRISHAQLFAGPAGSGALPLALAYAQYLSCEAPGGDDSCGVCPSCRKYSKLAHPDLHFSYPFIAPKKETVSLEFLAEWRAAFLEDPYLTLEKWLQRLDWQNKQPNINIAECHSIIRRLSLKSFESGFKVLIMWLPEYLREVGNSLLKLIEEPPTRTLFLLVSEQPDQLLSTLLSRTQLVRIGKLGEEEIARHLQEREGTDPVVAAQVASLSEGNLSAALDLVKGTPANHGDLFMDWMRICFQGKGLKIVEWVEQVASSGREHQKNFLRYGLSLLRKCILHSAGVPGTYNAAEKDFVENFSGYLHPGNSEGISRELEKAIYHIERNANPRILFLDVSLRIMNFLRTGKTAVRQTAV